VEEIEQGKVEEEEEEEFPPFGDSQSDYDSVSQHYMSNCHGCFSVVMVVFLLDEFFKLFSTMNKIVSFMLKKSN